MRHLLNLLLALCIYALPWTWTSGETITIDPKSRQFIDNFGRERILHGVNAVFKSSPFYPKLTGFDSNNTLSNVDAKLLSEYGFTVVRLGLIWGAIEPGKRGDYDYTYLAAMKQIVETLAKEGIYVLLDFHQDLWHRKYCGEGVPDWLQQECAAEFESGKTKPFPSPIIQTPYPLDQDGNPQLSSCLSKSFFDYYLSSEVSSAFQCLYDNKKTQWQALGDAWRAVAQIFKDHDNVLGYELINEPWFGDIFNQPDLLVPGKTEKKYLQPMYQLVHESVRAVDQAKVIFFEGMTTDYFPSGFTAAPGPSDYNNRQALSYHIYCLPNPNKLEVPLCAGANAEFFAMRKSDGERLGLPTIMTEFGAVQEQLKGALMDLESLAQQSDKHKQSWMYWQYKYYNDITTCTPSGESLFNNDGTPAVKKLETLTRPYPSAVAGTIVDYDFNIKTYKFQLSYTVAAANAAKPELEAKTTVIRLNPSSHYPKGVRIIVEGSAAQSVKLDCSSGPARISLIQAEGAGVDGDVQVTVMPCGRKKSGELDGASDNAACTCTFK